jgi:hypothetical protein
MISIQKRGKCRQLSRNKTSKCRACSAIFDSEKKLRHHIDEKHRITGDMTVTPREAEAIAHDVLSANFYASKQIFAISIIKKNDGNPLASKSSDSFKEAFGDLIEEGNVYARTMPFAIATLSLVNGVGDMFGQVQAIVTSHERCKLMLLPMPSYDIVVGLIVERSADLDSDKIANKIESLVTSTIKPEKKL